MFTIKIYLFYRINCKGIQEKRTGTKRQANESNALKEINNKKLKKVGEDESFESLDLSEVWNFTIMIKIIFPSIFYTFETY